MSNNKVLVWYSPKHSCYAAAEYTSGKYFAQCSDTHYGPTQDAARDALDAATPAWPEVRPLSKVIESKSGSFVHQGKAY